MWQERRPRAGRIVGQARGAGLIDDVRLDLVSAAFGDNVRIPASPCKPFHSDDLRFPHGGNMALGGASEEPDPWPMCFLT
jgi:hypothetical protein